MRSLYARTCYPTSVLSLFAIHREPWTPCSFSVLLAFPFSTGFPVFQLFLTPLSIVLAKETYWNQFYDISSLWQGAAMCDLWTLNIFTIGFLGVKFPTLESYWPRNRVKIHFPASRQLWCFCEVKTLTFRRMCVRLWKIAMWWRRCCLKFFYAQIGSTCGGDASSCPESLNSCWRVCSVEVTVVFTRASCLYLLSLLRCLKNC